MTAADLDSFMHVQVLGMQEADKHGAGCFATLRNDGDDALVCWCCFFSAGFLSVSVTAYFFSNYRFDFF